MAADCTGLLARFHFVTVFPPPCSVFRKTASSSFSLSLRRAHACARPTTAAVKFCGGEKNFLAPLLACFVCRWRGDGDGRPGRH